MTATLLIRLFFLPLVLVLLGLLILAIRQDRQAKRPFIVDIDKMPVYIDEEHIPEELPPPTQDKKNNKSKNK